MTKRQLLAMCTNNISDGNDGVPVWLNAEKAVVKAAEAEGLIRVVRTEERVAGYREWRCFLIQGKETRGAA